MSRYKRGCIPAVASPEEFFDFIEETPSGCWEWRGPIHSRGYGQLRIDGVHLLAHRYSYALHRGDLPHRMMVLHHCDNKPCVRPDHLYAGDASDNARDFWTRQASVLARHPVRGLAERTGFEPARGFPPTDFKSVARSVDDDI